MLPIASVGLIHGVYYLFTGVAPFISMRAFEAITGPKTDRWLVKTVGILVIAIGVTILYSVYKGQFPTETVLLSISSAAGLALIDVVYVLKKRIRKVYLADAAVESVLILLWLTAS